MRHAAGEPTLHAHHKDFDKCIAHALNPPQRPLSPVRLSTSKSHTCANHRSQTRHVSEVNCAPLASNVPTGCHSPTKRCCSSTSSPHDDDYAALSSPVSTTTATTTDSSAAGTPMQRRRKLRHKSTPSSLLSSSAKKCRSRSKTSRAASALRKLLHMPAKRHDFPLPRATFDATAEAESEARNQLRRTSSADVDTGISNAVPQTSDARGDFSRSLFGNQWSPPQSHAGKPMCRRPISAHHTSVVGAAHATENVDTRNIAGDHNGYGEAVGFDIEGNGSVDAARARGVLSQQRLKSLSSALAQLSLKSPSAVD